MMRRELMAVTVMMMMMTMMMMMMMLIIIINKSTMWTKCKDFNVKPGVYTPTKRL